MKNLSTYLLTVMLLLSTYLCVGCGSFIRFTGPETWLADSNDPNSGINSYIIEAKGKAADVISQQYASNIKTKEGLIADVFKRNGELFAGLILTTVGGLIFWGFTRSKYGWIIPSACIGGISIILFFVSYIKWIPLAVLVIVLGVLIWKAIEYHKERDALLAKEKPNA